MDVILGLGANLGSRRATLEALRLLLEARADVRVRACSRVFATAPVGPPQPDYLNAALRLDTGLSLEALLERVLRLEAELGRRRRERWGARVIDVDILWSGAGPYESPRLRVPHPRLSERPFALAPLLDVAPELGVELGPLLQRLGGEPPAVGRLGEGPAFGPAPRYEAAAARVEVEASTAPDALAAAAARLATSAWPGPYHRLQTHPFECRAAPGHEALAFVQAVLALASRAGRPVHATAWPAAPGHVGGCVLSDGTECTPVELETVQVQPTEAGGYRACITWRP